jgi:DNA-binding beta-propeller fold protein YncE
MAVVGTALVLVMSGCGATGATPRGSADSPSTPAGASATVSGAASATPASPIPAPTPTPPATDLIAYAATMDGNVVPVDLTTGRAEAPISADLRPEAIAITPNGRTAYVADAFTAAVTPIDLTTGVAGAAISIASTSGISSIAISPNGATVYVAVVSPAQAYGVVVPIDLATGVWEPGIPVGPDPVAIAITPDGSTAYVVNGGDGTITPIALPSDTTDPQIVVGGNPVDIGITPDGDAAYVMDGLDAGAVIPITLSAHPAQDVVGSAISAVSGEAQAIAIAPDGTTAVVVGGTGANLISLPSGAQIGTTISGSFTAVAITPDGTTALLGFADGTGISNGVLRVTLSTGTAGAPIILAGEPVAIAIRP